MQKAKITECHHIKSQLSAYFDNELSAWKRPIFHWHIKRCEGCSKIYTEIQQTHALLHSIESVKVSDRFLSTVMSQVNSMTTQKEKKSWIHRLGSGIEGLQSWMRKNIRVYNSYYIGGFFVGVFLMVGVTLYSPQINKLNLFSQFDSESIKQQERLVAFEVFIQEQPKRTLKLP